MLHNNEKKTSTFVNKENVLKSEIKSVNEFKRGPRRGGGGYIFALFMGRKGGKETF